MSNTPKIDEILGDFDTWHTCRLKECEHYRNFENAKDQLYQLILEVIGEDEEWKKEYPLSIKQDKKSRNNLKLEQRTKLNYLFGKDK